MCLQPDSQAKQLYHGSFPYWWFVLMDNDVILRIKHFFPHLLSNCILVGGYKDVLKLLSVSFMISL